MKQLLFVVFALLLLPLGLAVYEEVLDEDVVLVDGAQLYVQKPASVFEGNSFEIVLIPVIDEEGIEFEVSLKKDGEELEKTILIEEVYANQTTVVVWNDSIQEDTEYTLTYQRIGGDSSDQTFTITSRDKVIVDRSLQEKIYSPNEITDNQRNKLIQLLEEQNYKYSLGEFIEDEARASELVELDKKVYVETLIYNDESTTTRTVVVIDVEAQEPLLDLKIIETIPKDFAFHIDELFFSVDPIILEEDPVVMWHLEGIENERIEYSVQGNASLTGNTILVSSVVDEKDEESNSIPTGVLLPLLLIPLIAAIIIFFSKYAPKKK